MTAYGAFVLSSMRILSDFPTALARATQSRRFRWCPRGHSLPYACPILTISHRCWLIYSC